MTRNLRVLLAAGLAVLVTGAFAPKSAFANSSTEACLPVNAEAINEYIAESEQAGVSSDEVNRMLTQKWCLENVSIGSSNGSTVRLLADGSNEADVDWYNMLMFYDRDERVYIARATWSWRNGNFKKDDIVTCVHNDVGGKDGVAIRLSGGDMNILGKSAEAWGNPARNNDKNNYGTLTVPYSTVSDSGVGFRAQDKARRMMNPRNCDGNFDYNMYQGSVVVTFKALNSCRNVQMYPSYVHTWDSTSVNSIGAGPWNLAISWQSQGDNWEKTEGGPSARVC